jgi:endoribonuclease L-PSP, putative
MKQIVSTKQAPEAIGPYSQAVKINNMLYASGQLGIDPETGLFSPGGIKEQTIQAVKNVQAILKEVNASLDNVVKTTVFLSDMDDFTAMNEVYSGMFKEPYPARSAVAVKTLPKNALVEIEIIAAL